jgi:arginase family enzyme
MCCYAFVEGIETRLSRFRINAKSFKATTARPGARFGPQGIRWGSRRMEADFAWSIYTGMLKYKFVSEAVQLQQLPTGLFG